MSSCIDSKDEPAWLVAKADQRLAAVSDKDRGMEQVTVLDHGPLQILIYLTEDSTSPIGHDENGMDKWLATCDCCGKEFALREAAVGHVHRPLALIISLEMVFSLCPVCAPSVPGAERFDGIGE